VLLQSIVAAVENRENLCTFKENPFRAITALDRGRDRDRVAAAYIPEPLEPLERALLYGRPRERERDIEGIFLTSSSLLKYSEGLKKTVHDEVQVHHKKAHLEVA